MSSVNKQILIENICTLYLNGLSITQVSSKTDYPRSNVRYILNKKNILRTRKKGILLAATQGRIGKGFFGHS